MSEVQRYQVVERIAAGGMAEVYRGESAGIEGFRKKVAIKRVLPKLSANREFINMFLDEARLGAYLSHSRCVQVFDIGQGAGAHFIVMEYVDGTDLQGVLEFLQARGQTMSLEVACLIAMNVCEGLAYAHQAADHSGNPLNIVHRDISPHNVLITRFGEVKLVDFGLAKASSHLTDEDEDMVKGKFGYLAPEVTLGQGADKRVDIFAAGILLWEMLAGRRLFKGDSDVETFKQVRAAVVPDIREMRPEVDEKLWRVIQKALAREPNDRYSTADDFVKDLSLILLAGDRPVTYLDIARLVREAASERQKKRKAEGKDKAGLIGDLIIDTIHEYSEEMAAVLSEKPKLGTRGIQASGAAFVDPSAWGLDALFDEPAKASPPPKPAAPRAPAAEAASESKAAQPPSPPVQAPPPKPAAAAPAAPRPAAPPPKPAAAAPKKEGAFWKKWFGT
jgi:serine/threonine protein kinase